MQRLFGQRHRHEPPIRKVERPKLLPELRFSNDWYRSTAATTDESDDGLQALEREFRYADCSYVYR